MQRVPRYTINHPIILVGMMGCGKSTIGEVLGETLCLQFYDSDRILEKEASNSVANIHAVWGEDVFREEEYSVISKIFEENKSNPFILSTGDGSLCNEDIRELIHRSNAIIIWVDAPIEVLLERISRRSPRHPALSQSVDLVQALIELKEKRDRVYQLYDQYKVIVDLKGSRMSTAEKVLSLIESNSFTKRG